MRRDLLPALGGIILLTVAANFIPIPVPAQILPITLLIIWAGSQGTIYFASDIKPSGRSAPQPLEQMQTKDAYMFPIVGSAVLFSLYAVFKFLPAEYINIVVKGYFSIFGVLVLGPKIAQILEALLPQSLVHALDRKNCKISLKWFSCCCKSTNENNEPEHVDITILDALSYIAAIGLGVWYLKTNHWISNNILGIAFSLQGIEMLSIGSYLNGAILLSGLFIYDIFWVFGTEVMVTVAKSFDGPIKLLFPQHGLDLEGNPLRPSMLGLGDIVVPGFFIAMMLRFDHTPRESNKFTTGPNTKTPYFHATMFSYLLGLGTTIFVMYRFEAAQPALLYLVPACLGSSLLTGLVKGELKALWNYKEESAKKEDKGTVASDPAPPPPAKPKDAKPVKSRKDE